MLAAEWIARWFCIAGGALLLLGLVLWAVLPVHFVLPPYFFTPLLALGYGTYCWRRAQRRRNEPRE